MREHVAPVGLDEQLDDAWLNDAARHGDLDGVRALADRRRAASAREQTLEEQVDAAALALHQRA